ncbi:MAG: methyltransferase domain-containing protein [Ignavibacteria bacterium]|nr:methyltransferase domain-containing protein [Ignavibacteria bacterium]
MSSIKNAVEYVHSLLRSHVQLGDTVVDATIGNGRDTALLAELAGAHGHVYGFDIQQVALDVTQARLSGASANHTLFLKSHSLMLETLPQHVQGLVSAITFNLGYLPGGDKSIFTQLESTVSALLNAQLLLTENGIITIVCYRHAYGEQELESVRNELASWSQEKYTITETQFINQQGKPPIVFVVRRQT